jgi:hypothetical protein
MSYAAPTTARGLILTALVHATLALVAACGKGPAGASGTAAAPPSTPPPPLHRAPAAQ